MGNVAHNFQNGINGKWNQGFGIDDAPAVRRRASNELYVTYKPSSPGTLGGTVSITSNATDPSVVIDLSATATSAAVAD